LGLELAMLALWLIGNGLIITYAIKEHLILPAVLLYLALTAAVILLPTGPLMWIPAAVFAAAAVRSGHLLVRRQQAMADR